MSIFIWKSHLHSSTPINTITVHEGSSWALEVGHRHCISYERIRQTTCEDVIVYSIETHGPDWVGHHLLEKYTVPYQFLKKDAHGGVYEQIGEWIRYRSTKEVSHDIGHLKKEWERIKKEWMDSQNNTS